MSFQNPATKLSQHERENDGLRWVKLVRNVDDATRNFKKIRTIKPKQIDSKLIIEDKL